MKILVIGDSQGVFPSKLKNKLKKEDFDFIIGVGDYGGVKEWRPFIMDMFKRLKKGKEKVSPQEFFGKKRFKNLLKKDYEASKNVLRMLDSFGKPAFIVFGNTDDEWYTHPYYRSQKAKKKALNYLKRLKNVHVINYGKIKYKEFELVGFGGYMDIDAYFKKKTFKEKDKAIVKRWRKHQKMRTKLFKMLRETNKKSPKIFVFHYPPKGIFDIIKDKKNPMDRESAGVRFYSEAVKKYKPKVVLCGHMHEYRGMKKLYGVPVINPGDGEEGKAAIVDIDKKSKIKVKLIK